MKDRGSIDTVQKIAASKEVGLRGKHLGRWENACYSKYSVKEGQVMGQGGRPTSLTDKVVREVRRSRQEEFLGTANSLSLKGLQGRNSMFEKTSQVVLMTFKKKRMKKHGGLGAT